jgi:hypothetical protein
LWPEETKEWGQAFEAELPEITTPLASVRWVVGGAILLARESLRYFFKSLGRPLGVPAPSASSSAPHASGPAPRLPRVFAGFFLLASLTMLCLPEIRASLASSVLFGRTRVHEYFHERLIQRLREKASANHDPQLLAFLSLVYWQDDERFRLANEAIRRDPSLTWIDYSAAWWFWSDTDRSHFLSDERIARLEAFDPQNAVPRLLRAEAISHPVRATTRDNGTTKVPLWERAITKNAAWVAAMDRAFAAPQFHDYFSQQIALMRQVSERYHISGADLTSRALFANRLWDYGDIEAYSRFLIESGDKEAENGNWALATKDYEQVERFAEEIRDGSDSDWRSWPATIGSKAAKKLQAVFEGSGHSAEAQIAASKLSGWNETIDRFQSLVQQNTSGGRLRRAWSKTERAGFLINIAVLLVVVVFPVTLLALLSVGLASSFSRRILGRMYGVVCLAADAAPVALALSFALLFYAYHPYAHPFQNAATPEDMMAAAGVAHTLPMTARFLVLRLEIESGVYFWTAFTVVLCLLAAFLLVRMVARRWREV